MITDKRIHRPTGAAVLRAAVVLAASVAYLNAVFQFGDEGFWTAGLGDWMDPYFINALLEHWYRTALTLGDPSSPPMYFPVRGTLGYSHGLVLYAPFYIPLRVLAHPFVAHNLTLVLVILTGILCLYVLLRKLGLAFVEASALTAFFSTSQNVMSGTTGVWSQRASVFLIPPILLLLLVSHRSAHGRWKLVGGSLGGLFAALMYVQDFYTAHLAAVLVGLTVVPVLLVGEWRPLVRAARRLWSAGHRVVLVLALSAAAWTAYVLFYGGAGTELLGLRISSTAWERPLLLSLVLFLVYLRLRSGSFRSVRLGIARPWTAAVTVGALAGIFVFLWIHLDAYRQHRSFPEEHLLNALVQRDPSRWQTPADLARDLNAYDTLRPFVLALTTGVLVWLPWTRTDRQTRNAATWFMAVSLLVLLVPLRFGWFSAWRTFLEWLPGLAVIRDPKRIIYPYELLVVLAVGWLLSRVHPRSVLRVAIEILVLALILTTWKLETFATSRSTALYDRWVAAPIAIHPACRAFFIKAAGDEHALRSADPWTLYGNDSTFIALHHSIPTLNGYSAWWPPGWELFNPRDADYQTRVARWIERHGLTGVCALDIEARRMTPL